MCQDNLTPGNNSRKTHINVKEPEPRCSADRPPRVWLICGEKGLSSCLHLPSVQGGGCDGATSHARAHTHRGGNRRVHPNRHSTSQRDKFLESRKQCGIRYKKKSTHSCEASALLPVSSAGVRALFCALQYTCTVMKRNNMFTNSGKEREFFFLTERRQ